MIYCNIFHYVIETLTMWFGKKFWKKFSSAILNNLRRVKQCQWLCKERNKSFKKKYVLIINVFLRTVWAMLAVKNSWKQCVRKVFFNGKLRKCGNFGDLLFNCSVAIMWLLNVLKLTFTIANFYNNHQK